MMDTITIEYFHKDGSSPVGTLSDSFDFYYDKKFQGQISLSLPRENEKHSDKVVEHYFDNLLPEDINRVIIAQNERTSFKNTFVLLKALGGDFAGALFIAHDDLEKTISPSYTMLSEDRLVKLLKQLPSMPLLHGYDNNRLSLAGVQQKCSLLVKDNTIYSCHNGAAGTHILKPQPEKSPYKYLVENEYVCMLLARSIGLRTAAVTMRTIQHLPILIVERYDRTMHNNEMFRLHQEDFCQALGPLKGIDKYSGNYKDIFNLLKQFSTQPALDIRQLLKWVLFNYLIGNADNHLKNISILYDGHMKRPHLAPFYDMISTAIYPDIQSELAIPIGDEVSPGQVDGDDWQKLIDDAGVSKRLLPELLQEITTAIDFNMVTTSAITAQIQHVYNERLGWLRDLKMVP